MTVSSIDAGQPQDDRTPSPGSELVIASSISASYTSPAGRVLDVLNDVSLTIKRGEIVAILGPSGCGKSTLLRLLSGIASPDGGSISYCSGMSRTSPIPMVLQTPALLPWRTVAENIALAMEMQGRRDAVTEARRYASLVGLAGFEEFRANALSGGMRARVSFARALAAATQLILLDEPFSHLDEVTRGALNQLLCEHVERRHFAAVIVGHDIDEALSIAHRVVVLSKRPGKVVLDRTITRRHGTSENLDQIDRGRVAQEVRRIASEHWI
jgi:NitT/TauT family transport system ATP-binding protein